MGKLTVIKDNLTYALTFEKSETVLRILQKNGFILRAACAGKGTCGHCKIMVNENIVQACQTMAEDDMVITLLADTLKTDIETLPCQSSAMSSHSSTERYGIAIDIGTTTIALALVNLSNGQVVASHGFLNSTVTYGADVLSRIEASNHGYKEELQHALITSLFREIKTLLECTQIKSSHLESICIAANTTMCHLLLGLSCETLGKAPFSPIMIDYPIILGEDFFAGCKPNPFSHVTIKILSGLSAFIGGDITSGFFSLASPRDIAPFLFVDLGTNGEMVLSTKERFFAASVAAGPAFEGSRIPGSIVLEAVYEMQKKKVLDKTGLLHGMHFRMGYRYENHIFTQEDIRSIQLAKASVRAGIETLLAAANITAMDIEHIYLCGGFGTHTNTDIAVSIGMFPEDFLGKITPMGNTSLAGAVQYLTKKDDGFFMDLQKKTELVELASSTIYQESYIRWMDFL